MAIQSFPLIAVDYQGIEHHLEWQGDNQGHAAKHLLRKHSHYRCVLNGRKPGSRNNPYRKLICVQHGVEVDAAQTALGLALTEAQSEQSLAAGRLILASLQKRGLRLEIVVDDDSGTERIVVSPRGMITPMEREEIDENQAGIAELLRQQEEQEEKEATTNDAPPPDAPRETQRDIIRKMLPELPDSFGRADLQEALRRWDYNDLAEKNPKLDSLLAWCATQGLILRSAKGHYQRIKITHTEQEEPSPAEANDTASPVSETPETAPVTPVITRESQPETTISQPPLVPPPFVQILRDLAAESATTPIDDAKLEAIEAGINEFFEKVVDPVHALVKQLRANNVARARVRAQLAAADSGS